jgi:hypothetical protein
MARPITWQNVQGPDSSSGFRAIEAAGRSINAGFDQFGGLIKDAQAVDAANWEQVKKNNTQDFLNKLYSATGPEQFKALQDSGQLQEMIAKNGAQIDQAAARSAMDGRLSTLQQRDTQEMQFKNAVANQANIELDRKEEPITYQVKALLANGDPGSMAMARQLTNGLSARGQSIMLGSLDARAQELIKRDRGNKEWIWKEEEEKQKQVLRPLEVQSRESSIRASNASAAASAEAASASRENRVFTKQERERADARNKAAAALQGNLYAEGEYTSANAEDIGKLLTENGIGDDAPERRKIIARLEKLAGEQISMKVTRDGKEQTVKVPLPLSLVKATLLSSTDEIGNRWNEGWANDFEEKLRKRMEETSIGPDGRAYRKSTNDLAAFREIMGVNAQNGSRQPKK